MTKRERHDHRESLFQPAAVKEAMNRDGSRTEAGKAATERLRRWQHHLSDETKRTQLGEEKHRQNFLRDVFEGLLGYKTLGESDPYHLEFELTGPADTRPADGALGYFGGAKRERVRAVIEVKGPGTDLDARSNRKDNLSPVDQAFLYAAHQENCWWVVVTNFDEIRLYQHQRGSTVYEEFLFEDLAGLGTEFGRFCYLLHRDHLIGDAGEKPLTLRLAEQRWRAQADITKTFYAEYQDARIDLFKELREQNPGESALDILEATQLLLDRLLFVMFCADRGLLPHDVVQRLLQTAHPKHNFAYGPDTLWRTLLGLFDAVNVGRDAAGVTGYNGGLFARALLDELTLNDRTESGQLFVLRRILRWDQFDFESQIDVDILGHVFENSISDLEQLRAEIASDPSKVRLSWRNKEGIFYTPPWVTRYIVRHSVGRYLEENPDVGTEFKVLDPACGSGAFLTQLIPVFREHIDQLAPAEMEELREAQAKEDLTLFSDPSFLKPKALYAAISRAIYGVDRSRESVEITRLSFWLQTVVKGNPLPRLEDNLKHGNSLCDNAEKAPDAFIWSEEFPELGETKADVVVGNPPWVTTSPEYSDCIEDKFEIASGHYDLAFVFMEAALELLKPGGILGFIVPDSILFREETEGIRRMLAERNTLLEVIKMGEGVFPGVFRGSAIILVQKGEPPASHVFDGLIVKKADRKSVTDVASSVNLDVLMAQRGSTIPLDRIRQNPLCEFDIFVGQEDEVLIKKIGSRTLNLEEVVEHGRGVELNSEGHVVRCPHCFKWDAPPSRRRGVFTTKTCTHCGEDYEKDDALSETNIIYETGSPPGPGQAYFVDGTDVNRYRITGRRIIETNRDGINYKEPELYEGQKIVWRKTGVGIMATIDYDMNAYVPQVVYLLKLKSDLDENLSRYRLEYLLGVANSRVMLYYYFKKTAEIEWQSFPHWTLSRITSLPIRAIDWSNSKEVRLHDRIAGEVEKLIRKGASEEPDEDLHIERLVMELFDLTAQERQRVWETLRSVQELKIIREVLPPQRISPKVV